MKKFTLLLIALLLAPAFLLAQNPPPRISDEGGAKSVYFNLDCVGDNVGCTTSGINATLTVIDPTADFWNGTFRESFNALVIQNAPNVDLTLEQSGGGDLTMRFSDGETTLDCTPICSVQLTEGTDAAPQENYVYIPQSTKVLTVSTTDWPSEEHIRVTYALVPSDTFVGTDGPYINQNWNDHLQGTDGWGHLPHIGERLRYLSAIYHSGVGGNGDGGTYIERTNGTPDTVYLKTTTGIVMQLHRHNWQAFDSSAGDTFLIPNSSVQAYEAGSDLYNFLVDADGDSMENKYYNLTIWGVANKGGTYTPLMVNLPTCSYNNQTNAEQDVNSCDVYSIGSEFEQESSTGFLIARLTMKHANGGQDLELVSTVDLRGTRPQSVAGGGATHDAVTITGAGTYLSIAGQEITQDALTESDISDLSHVHASDGANCLAGEIPLGVDTAGAVQGCYEPTEADITDLDHTGTASDNEILYDNAGIVDGIPEITFDGSNLGIDDDTLINWGDAGGTSTNVYQTIMDDAGTYGDAGSFIVARNSLANHQISHGILSTIIGRPGISEVEIGGGHVIAERLTITGGGSNTSINGFTFPTNSTAVAATTSVAGLSGKFLWGDDQASSGYDLILKDQIGVGDSNSRIEFQVTTGTTAGYIFWDNGSGGSEVGLTLDASTVSLDTTSGSFIKVLEDGVLSYTIPNTDGSANQVLQTDGAGTASWGTLDYTGTASDTELLFDNAGIVDGASEFTYASSRITGSGAGSILLQDNVELYLGTTAGADGSIYFDGTEVIFDDGSSDLRWNFGQATGDIATYYLGVGGSDIDDAGCVAVICAADITAPAGVAAILDGRNFTVGGAAATAGTFQVDVIFDSTATTPSFYGGIFTAQTNQAANAFVDAMYGGAFQAGFNDSSQIQTGLYSIFYGGQFRVMTGNTDAGGAHTIGATVVSIGMHVPTFGTPGSAVHVKHGGAIFEDFGLFKDVPLVYDIPNANLLVGGDTKTYYDSASGEWRLEVDGTEVFAATGSTLGFFNSAPSARAAAYTITNVTTDRAYDANATTTAELADALGTLIADLKTYGLLQ